MNKDLIPYVLNVLKTVLLLTEGYTPVEREFNSLFLRGMIRIVNNHKKPLPDPVHIGRNEMRLLIGNLFVRMAILDPVGDLDVFIGENLFDEDFTKVHYTLPCINGVPASLYYQNVREDIRNLLTLH
ncbi:MAG: hypothetical protein V1848_01810 [Candidatus Magasanikbacteria bacterium]